MAVLFHQAWSWSSAKNLEPKQGTQLFLKYCDRAFNSSSLVRPENCRDPSVAGSSPDTGTLPVGRPESLRSPYYGLALYTNQTKPRL
ncbi:hypothetical protein PoB_000819100 [Plakobranchus ocellatus]|uniref:Uncharacterized protein n=1 Tax=Plakobranchus ocellatus TaxID=259542 RepID=A0AAV3YH44_9GAST|nr:hypothetical protein PoB_000819100 [Plakobranchus ocellatus]